MQRQYSANITCLGKSKSWTKRSLLRCAFTRSISRLESCTIKASFGLYKERAVQQTYLRPKYYIRRTHFPRLERCDARIAA